MTITLDQFLKVQIRIGVIIDAKPFPESKKPAIKLWIDFGNNIGVKKSSAQIVDLYNPENLIGKSIIAVTNLPPLQVGKFISEVLTLGLNDNDGKIVLLEPKGNIPNGSRLL